MKYSNEHFFAIDAALGLGFEITVEGKTWKFSALCFDDMKQLAIRARSEAMAAYQDAMEGRRIDPRQRTMDVNGILFGTVAQEAVDSLQSPGVRRLAVYLSLKKNHPEIKAEADVAPFFDKESFAASLVHALEVATYGPIKQDKGSDEERPTQAQPVTTSA